MFPSRFNRLSYLAAHGAIITLGGGVQGVLDSFKLEIAAAGLGAVLLVLYLLACARRLNDIGVSGWWQAPVNGPFVVLMIVWLFPGREAILDSGFSWLGRPVVISWFVLVAGFGLSMWLWPGQKHANRFGAPPEGILGYRL